MQLTALHFVKFILDIVSSIQSILTYLYLLQRCQIAFVEIRLFSLNLGESQHPCGV